MSDIILWLGAVGAALGFARNALDVVTGKEELPKKFERGKAITMKSTIAIRYYLSTIIIIILIIPPD